MSDYLLNGIWEEKADMPALRGAFGVGVIDNKIYCPGGGFSSTGNTFADLLIYDIDTDSWSTGASMPGPRINNPCVVYNGKLYCFGGRTSSAITNTVFIYDPSTDHWDTGTDMPVARLTHGAAQVDGKVYVMGGYISYSGVTTNTMHIYDIENDRWSEGPGMVQAVDHLGTVVLDNKIYAISSNCTQVFVISTNTWEKKTAGNIPGTYMADIVLYDKYAIVTGSEAPGSYSNVKIYDTEEDVWLEGVPMNYPRRATGAIVGNRIYAIGGYYANQNKLEVFTIEDDKGGSENPGTGNCCCCGKFRMEVEIPICNNLEVLPEIQKLAQIIKGCDNSGCCKS